MVTRLNHWFCLHFATDITYLLSMNDRTLGYFITVFLLIFFLVPAIILSAKFLGPVHHRTIVFEDINTLSFIRIQDEVKIRGIHAGTVKHISCREKKAYVVIETKQALAVHQGYRIVAESKGFMGDRYLEIYPGNSNAPVIDPETELKGYFPMGPTESLQYINKLSALIDSIGRFAVELRDGTSKKQSFAVQYKIVTAKMDSIITSVLRVSKSIDRLAGNKIDTVAAFVEKTNSVSKELTSSLPEMVASLDGILKKTGRVIDLVDNLVTSSDSLLKKLDSPEALTLNNYFRTLKSRIETLRNIVLEIRESGLRLPVKIGP